MGFPRQGLAARVATLGLMALVVVTVGCGSTPDIDEEFPPGDPVVGRNTPDVLGTPDGAESTNYTLWVLLAVCLIVAGILLVRVERWERNRHRE